MTTIKSLIAELQKYKNQDTKVIISIFDIDDVKNKAKSLDINLSDKDFNSTFDIDDIKNEAKSLDVNLSDDDFDNIFEHLNDLDVVTMDIISDYIIDYSENLKYY